jgi:glycerol-3-phosphate acyltransferase PlsX
MKSIVRIALDVMGGDKGPSIAIAGAAETLIRHPDVRFIMHGDEALCRPILETFPALKAVTTLHHSEISIAMDDKPSQALRRGRGKSSMWRAIQSVKDGEADVAVSAGNTGALMAMATFCLRTMQGINRPAIAAIWPTIRGESIVLDVGATIGADAQHYVDLAMMGSAMARIVLGVARPTVGLLNVGVCTGGQCHRQAQIGPQLALELEQQALGCFFAYARHLGQATSFLAADGAREIVHAHA